jgi:phytoene desaturase
MPGFYPPVLTTALINFPDDTQGLSRSLILLMGTKHQYDTCDNGVVIIPNAARREERTMSKPSVIIIGAGLGGLSTGIYAQSNGYRCQIFDHARHPGGVAAQWKRQGYTIDGGIHFYMGYRRGRPDHDLYRELGVYQADQYLEITNYGRFIDPNSGRSLDITQDLDQLAASMRQISPKDTTFINKFIKGAKAFRASSMTATMQKPPEMTRWWDTLKMMFKMRRTLRYYSGWYMQSIGKATRELHDPWLAHVFKYLFLPDVPVVFVMIVLGALAGRNMAVRRDGSGGFARALEKRYLDLGGTVAYGSTVEKILAEKDQAVGVRLKNGEEYRADHIVSAADGFSTLYDLLDGQYTTAEMKKLHEEWPLWKPVVLINYGVDRDFSQEPSIMMLQSTSPVGAGFLASDCWVIRVFNYCPDCAPADRTLVQVMIESEWQPWKDLRKNKNAYNAEKEMTARQVLTRLDAVWPGIKDQVDMTNVATPYTWWRYTRNRRGAFEGFAINDKVFTTSVKRALPNLDNFYMAGQWVVPGGGVIPTLLSGKHAAMLLCRRDGIAFNSPDQHSN